MDTVAPPPPHLSLEKDIPGKPSYRCTNYSPSECTFRDAVCHSYNKTGHNVKACRRQKQRPSALTQQQNYCQSKSINQVEMRGGAIPRDLLMVLMKFITSRELIFKPLYIQMNQTDLQMELDTRVAASLISEKTYKMQWSSQMQPKLKASDVRLHTYTKENVYMLGSVVIESCPQGQKGVLTTASCSWRSPSHFGRDWLMELQLDWCELSLGTLVPNSRD